MNESTIQKVNRALNQELIRRLLVKYFVEKGAENFKMPVYPPALQDLVEKVPYLDGKVEIVPFAEDIDPRTGYGKLGWNLFVLGNQVMFLGYTEHSNLAELGRNIGGGEPISGGQSSHESTPERIISFITRLLGGSEAGMLRQVEPSEMNPMRVSMPNGSYGFYKRSGAGNL
jgi:hypothetical protein